MEFYRSSVAGVALTKALNTMLESGELTMQEALVILDEFDRAFVESMRNSYATQKNLEKIEAKVMIVLCAIIVIYDINFVSA